MCSKTLEAQMDASTSTATSALQSAVLTAALRSAAMTSPVAMVNALEGGGGERVAGPWLIHARAAGRGVEHRRQGPKAA